MHKLGIIVPYRNREEHLKKFVPHMKNFLLNKIDYKILIVEQDDQELFNRGRLKNIGFHLGQNDFDYFCFHDVDHLPVSDTCDYSYTDSVIKLANRVSQFNFCIRPKEELAGVILFNKKKFLNINGFSNDYIGWGVEDTDIGLRCIKKNIDIDIRDGVYMSLPHLSEGDTNGQFASNEVTRNRYLFNSIKDSEKLFFSGLSNLKYEISKIKEEERYQHIWVKNGKN